MIHHARILLDETGAARDLDTQDSHPGYDGLMLDHARFPDGHFPGLGARQDAGVAAGRDRLADRARHRSRAAASPAARARGGRRATGSRAPLRGCSGDADARLAAAHVEGHSHPRRRPGARHPGQLSVAGRGRRAGDRTPHALPGQTNRGGGHAAGRARRAVVADRRLGLQLARTSTATRSQSTCRPGTELRVRFTFDNSSHNPRKPPQPAGRGRFRSGSDRRNGGVDAAGAPGRRRGHAGAQAWPSSRRATRYSAISHCSGPIRPTT